MLNLFILIFILIVCLFGMIFAWINSATKQIDKLFKEFYELELRFEELRDFYFELNSNINKTQKDINQIKGQIFIVNDRGEQ